MIKERSEASPGPSVQSNKQSHRRSDIMAIPIPNRRERRLEFGIDMLDTVVFGHW